MVLGNGNGSCASTSQHTNKNSNTFTLTKALASRPLKQRIKKKLNFGGSLLTARHFTLSATGSEMLYMFNDLSAMMVEFAWPSYVSEKNKQARIRCHCQWYNHWEKKIYHLCPNISVHICTRYYNTMLNKDRMQTHEITWLLLVYAPIYSHVWIIYI